MPSNMMPSLHFTSAFLAFIAVCGVALFRPASALDVTYCSSINTSGNQKSEEPMSQFFPRPYADDFWIDSSIYQSNGLCHDFCTATYAFAVLQTDGCWCSNYIPASTVSTSECDFSCPGYPGDLCGAENLFGYIALNVAASGTKGAGSSTPSTTQKSSATPEVSFPSVLNPYLA